LLYGTVSRTVLSISQSATKIIAEEQKQHAAPTTEELCDLLKDMTITQSTDSGFAITHHGHIAGIPTIAISTCHGIGECYLIQ
jgi:hypothetical protein